MVIIVEEARLSVCSFYAGVGILDLAFAQSGFEVVLVNEFDRDFARGYQFAHARMGVPKPRYGMLRTSAERFVADKAYLRGCLDSERARGRAVGFIGGPPCPDFSVAGKNHGAEGSNGRLTRIYFDLIEAYSPDFFVFENVKGLTKTAKHRVFFDEQKEKMTEAGYLLFEALLNSLEFGVPQSRDRVFLIGINQDAAGWRMMGGIDALSVVSKLETEIQKRKKFNIDDVLAARWPSRQPFHEDGQRYFVYNKSPLLNHH